MKSQCITISKELTVNTRYRADSTGNLTPWSVFISLNCSPCHPHIDRPHPTVDIHTFRSGTNIGAGGGHEAPTFFPSNFSVFTVLTPHLPMHLTTTPPHLQIRDDALAWYLGIVVWSRADSISPGCDKLHWGSLRHFYACDLLLKLHC